MNTFLLAFAPGRGYRGLGCQVDTVLLAFAPGRGKTVRISSGYAVTPRKDSLET